MPKVVKRTYSLTAEQAAFIDRKVASGEYAVRRGRSRAAWVWVAAVIGPLALLALLLIPPKAA